MRKKKEHSSQCADWMNTYSDMVTLLLTFFVLLFAMSSMSSEKWKKIATAINARAGVSATSSAISQNANGLNGLQLSSLASVPSEASSSETNVVVDKVRNFDDLYPYFKNYIEKNNLENEIVLYRGDGYNFFSFRSTIFFNGDSAVLQPGGKKILDFLCDAISGIPDQIGEIRFYGHTAKVSATDTASRQAFDRGLSDDRAMNVLLYVQSKKIISGRKMVSAGYGEYWPIVKDDGTEETRAKNRRVEIYISKAGKTDNILPEIYNNMATSSSSSTTNTVNSGSAAKTSSETSAASAVN